MKAKTALAQDELEALAAVAALGPVVQPVTEPAEQPVVTHPGGWTTKEVVCPTHQQWFTRTRIPRSDVTVGQCPACAKDKELEDKAKATLASRRSEITAKVLGLTPEYEPEVQRQVVAELDAEVERYTAEVRPMIEADVRGRLHEQLVARVEEEVLAEIRAGLQEPK